MKSLISIQFFTFVVVIRFYSQQSLYSQWQFVCLSVLLDVLCDVKVHVRAEERDEADDGEGDVGDFANEQGEVLPGLAVCGVRSGVRDGEQNGERHHDDGADGGELVEGRALNANEVDQEGVGHVH